MFHGTTIEELLNIVERAEEQARVEPVTMELKSEAVTPVFMSEIDESTGLVRSSVMAATALVNPVTRRRGMRAARVVRDRSITQDAEHGPSRLSLLSQADRQFSAGESGRS